MNVKIKKEDKKMKKVFVLVSIIVIDGCENVKLQAFSTLEKAEKELNEAKQKLKADWAENWNGGYEIEETENAILISEEGNFNNNHDSLWIEIKEIV